MDFGSRRKSASGGAGGRFSLQKEKVVRPSPLTIYADPPSDAIALEDFESLAVERLKVLSACENAASRGEPPDRVLKKLEEAVRDTHLEVCSDDDKVADNVSHWVLRLAFAATEDLRKRFLAFEVMLFKLRFEKRLDMGEVQRFMADNQLGYKPIERREFQQNNDSLRDVFMATAHIRAAKVSAGGLAGQPFDTMQFYKVSFTEVPDLVSRRMVFVSKGFAFVPESDLIFILVSRFRIRLSQKLAIAFRSLPYVCSDERLRPILKTLETAYVGPEWGADNGGGCGNRDVRAETLDGFANNMPMCMREIHAAMKREHHLKYHARLQFQLFLKGVGLSMADCLRFFQQEFAKKPTPPDVFQKKYAYSIRHMYGQEGKRSNYRAYDCVKIITGVQPANSAEHHGCPFKTYAPTTLRRIFTKQVGTVNMRAVDEIMEKVEQKQYGLACRRHFELSHPGGDSGNVGNHPNAWFDESVAHFEKLALADGTAKTAAANNNPTGVAPAIAATNANVHANVNASPAAPAALS